jgi:hypothetical protein
VLTTGTGRDCDVSVAHPANATTTDAATHTALSSFNFILMPPPENLI